MNAAVQPSKLLEDRLLEADTEVYGYAAVKLAELLGEAADELKRFRDALSEIASVTAPLDMLEINHRYDVECAREALEITSAEIGGAE